MSFRFQLSRQDGSRHPEGGISGARPHALGNPFSHDRPEYAVAAFERFARHALFLNTAFAWMPCDRWGNPVWFAVRRENLPCPVRIGSIRPFTAAFKYPTAPPPAKMVEFVPDAEFPEPLLLRMIPDGVAFHRRVVESGDRPIGCFCRTDAEWCHVDVILKLRKEWRDAATQQAAETHARTLRDVAAVYPEPTEGTAAVDEGVPRK